MVSTYCHYGLYDEENCRTLEVGDRCDKFFYTNNNGESVILENVKIESISRDRVIVESNNFDTVVIDVEDIIEWEV